MWKSSIDIDKIDNGFILKITVQAKDYADISREMDEYQATAAEVLTRIQEFTSTAVSEVTTEIQNRINS